MKHEFRVNGTIKLVLTSTNDLEDKLFKEMFGDEDVITVTKSPDAKEVTIQKKKKDE